MNMETRVARDNAERRQSPRVPFSAPIMVRTPSGSAHRATSENLSELGMLLHASGDELARAVQPLWVTFNLPSVPNLLQVQAEVVHRRQDGQMVSLGLHFLTPPPLVRRMLRTYVFTGRGVIKEYDPPSLN